MCLGSLQDYGQKQEERKDLLRKPGQAFALITILQAAFCFLFFNAQHDLWPSHTDTHRHTPSHVRTHSHTHSHTLGALTFNVLYFSHSILTFHRRVHNLICSVVLEIFALALRGVRDVC